MKKNKNLHSFLPLVIIIIISAAFRFIYLDRIPNAISGDELIYPLTAKSVVLTGRDMTGAWNIFNALIFRYPPNQQQAELPYFLHLPFSGIFPFSLFTAHLPFAILSIGIVILLYIITQTLFGTPIAFATGFIAAINPWFIVMGRTGYESTPATFFYLLAFVFILKAQGWKVVWAAVPLLLAFYSYIGTKIILLPFVIVSLSFAYIKNKPKSLKPYVTLLATCIIIVIIYMILINISSGMRINDIFLPNDQIVTDLVNEIRRKSVVFPYTNLLINKYSIYAKLLFEKLIRIFSLSYLFVEGDRFFPVRGFSFFYIIDSISIALGILFLFAKRKIYFFLLSILVFIGTLPHLFFKLSGDFSGHLAFMFPFIIMLAGIGIKEIIFCMAKRWSMIFGSIIIIIYVCSAFYFGYIYFFVHPLQEYGDFHMHVLSRYLALAKQKNIPILLYSSTNRDFLNKYLFYTNSLSKETIRSLSLSNINDSFDLNGVSFRGCIPINNASANQTIIMDAICTPSTMNSYHSISRLTDGGPIYNIENDILCQKHNLKQYPNKITTYQLAIDAINEQAFCETYISKN